MTMDEKTNAIEPAIVQELRALAAFDSDDHEDGTCIRCHASMRVELGDEETALCHDCAHWVFEHLGALLAFIDSLKSELADASADVDTATGLQDEACQEKYRAEEERDRLRAELTAKTERVKELAGTTVRLHAELESTKAELSGMRATFAQAVETIRARHSSALRSEALHPSVANGILEALTVLESLQPAAKVEEKKPGEKPPDLDHFGVSASDEAIVDGMVSKATAGRPETRLDKAVADGTREQHPDGEELACTRCGNTELPPFAPGDRCPMCQDGKLTDTTTGPAASADAATREDAGATPSGEALRRSAQAAGAGHPIDPLTLEELKTIRECERHLADDELLVRRDALLKLVAAAERDIERSEKETPAAKDEEQERQLSTMAAYALTYFDRLVVKYLREARAR